MLRTGFSFGGKVGDLLEGELLPIAATSALPQHSDAATMQLALRAAMRAVGISSPNPPVGCVVRKDHKILAIGYTHAPGGPHAERHAAQQMGVERFPAGCEVFVTLEPCSHQGRTPPCTELFPKEPCRVLVATEDPFEEVKGRGLELLRQQGHRVEVGLCAVEARAMLLPFLTESVQQRLFVGLKWAQSLDGCLADDSHRSQWLTAKPAQRINHWLRQKYDALAVGYGTALADKPSLTARELPKGIAAQHPLKVCLDPRGRLLQASPSESKTLLQNVFSPKWLVLCGQSKQEPQAPLKHRDWGGNRIIGVSTSDFTADVVRALRLPEVASFAGRERVQSLLIEGGATILGGFLSAGCFDVLHTFTAPVILGGSSHRIASGDLAIDFPQLLAQAERLSLLQCLPVGQDSLAEWLSPQAASLVQGGVGT